MQMRARVGQVAIIGRAGTGVKDESLGEFAYFGTVQGKRRNGRRA